MNDLTIDFLEYLAINEFTPFFQQYQNIITAYQYQKVFEITDPFLTGGKRALDWSCGDGHFSTYLSYRKMSTTAFSFAARPVSFEGNPLIEFVQGDCSEPVLLPFADQAFDLVFSIGVLEHVHETGGEQLASLREIYRILKPGGYFFCFHLPYSGGWVEPIARAAAKYKRGIFFHSLRFSEKMTRELILSSRLDWVKWGRYNCLPRNIFKEISQNFSRFVKLYNKLDARLENIFPFICNQTYVIARRG